MKYQVRLSTPQNGYISAGLWTSDRRKALDMATTFCPEGGEAEVWLYAPDCDPELLATISDSGH